jgi:aminoglycoside phosphotransferase (APT) family kinase protein
MHNTLIYRGEAFLLDWERSGIGDPAFEIGLIPIFFGMAGTEERRFLDAYMKLMPSYPHFLEKVRAYHLVHVLAWPMHMLSFLYRLKREGYRTSWQQDDFVHAYLAEAYGWLAFAVRSLASPLGLSSGAGMTEGELRSTGTLFLWKQERM